MDPLQTAALKLLRWCQDNGLLTPEAYFPGDGYAHPVLAPMDNAALALLRQKQIRFVGINYASQAITVFLKKVAPAARAALSLPQTCDGFPLIFRQGNPDTVSPSHIAQAASPSAVHQVAGTNYYTCGSSISVGNDRVAGTLGCLVRDQAGVIYGLSNNHVSGCCNYAPARLPIVAPGVLDVTPTNVPPFTIGYHARQLPMVMGDPTVVNTADNRDAAIFELNQPGWVSSMQQTDYDTPAGSLPLATGMEVEKVGRSSGYTRGTVVACVVGPINVSYSAPQYQFNGVVYFDKMFVVYGAADRFSEPGDSGSLVVHKDQNNIRHAVGIVIAGGDDSAAPGGKVSFIMPIEPILNEFQVTLVSGHNA
jgi:hypothetical protein